MRHEIRAHAVLADADPALSTTSEALTGERAKQPFSCPSTSAATVSHRRLRVHVSEHGRGTVSLHCNYTSEQSKASKRLVDYLGANVLPADRARKGAAATSRNYLTLTRRGCYYPPSGVEGCGLVPRVQRDRQSLSFLMIASSPRWN